MELPQSLRRELERMNAGLGFDPADLEARRALHDRHVNEFSSQLRSRVREALENEGQSLVAGDWIADAERLVRQHFAPPPLSGDQRRAAARAEQSDLAHQLRDAAVSVPEEEVEEHATELAQLLLSNWFGLLEHAMQDNPVHLIELDMDALPKTAHLDAVLQGCAAFALPALSAATALRQYQRGFALDSITPLSPTLHLVRAGSGWQLSRTYEGARRALDAARPAAHPQHMTARERMEAVLGLLRPWALARPMELPGAATAPLVSALTIEDEFRLTLEATQQLRSGAEETAAAEIASLKDMADMMVLDITDAVAGTSTPSDTWRCERDAWSAVLIDPQLGEADAASIYRIALSSAGLMLAGEPLPAAHEATQPERSSLVEKQILRCSVAAARHALAGADHVALRRALQQAAATELLRQDSIS